MRRSSRELLAARVRACARAWDSEDEVILRYELAELAQEALLLSRTVPLGGVSRRQAIAGHVGEPQGKSRRKAAA